METKCGHKVLFGDVLWLMTGRAFQTLTDAPTIMVVFMSKQYFNAYYSHLTTIEEDYYRITRYENGTSNGASLSLKTLKGELKTIIDAKIKDDNKRTSSQSD